jgi:ubiquinone/menaquinone biosynthesis C-methylase UbiE
MKSAHVLCANTSPGGTHARSKFVNVIHVERNILQTTTAQDIIPVARRKLLIGVSTAMVAFPSLTNNSSATVINPPLPPPITFSSSSSFSSSTDDIKESYNQYAEKYDNLDGGVVADALGFPDQRKALLQEATGDVLETAVGTGINLQYYNLRNLRSFTAIDLSPGMLRQAQLKATTLQFPLSFTSTSSSSSSDSFLSFQQADVATLPFPDNSFDSVVDTFSLCVFPDPAAALRNMARVVRPGGKVLLLEHSRSTFPVLGWYQDLTAAQVASMGKGCVWNQNVIKLVGNAGLSIERVDKYVGDLILSITAVKL